MTACPLNPWTFVLSVVAVLGLTLTVPLLPRVASFNQFRLLAVLLTFVAGITAVFFLARPPALFLNPWPNRFGLFDGVLIASIWLFAGYGLHAAARWGKVNMTFHKTMIVGAFGYLSLYALSCLWQRARNWKKADPPGTFPHLATNHRPRGLVWFAGGMMLCMGWSMLQQYLQRGYITISQKDRGAYLIYEGGLAVITFSFCLAFGAIVIGYCLFQTWKENRTGK